MSSIGYARMWPAHCLIDTSSILLRAGVHRTALSAVSVTVEVPASGDVLVANSGSTRVAVVVETIRAGKVSG
jgi:hypothetical protein